MADIDGLLVDTLKTALVTPTGGSQDTLANHLGLLAPKASPTLTGTATVDRIKVDKDATVTDPSGTIDWATITGDLTWALTTDATVAFSNLPSGDASSWVARAYASSGGPHDITVTGATVVPSGTLQVPAGGAIVLLQFDWDGTTLSVYGPHVGEGGSAHAAATTSVAGFLSSTDKAKLDGIATSATANPNAIETDQSGEIAALTEKTTPVSADLILIEDSAASNAKKKVQIGNLPGGSGGTYTLNVVDYTTPGTTAWTPHADAVWVDVIVVAGGGGGGSGGQGATNDSGGGGGMGGGVSRFSGPISMVGAGLNIVVGVGGTGGAARSAGANTAGANGGYGGDSSFGTLAVAGRGSFGDGGGTTTSNGGSSVTGGLGNYQKGTNGAAGKDTIAGLGAGNSFAQPGGGGGGGGNNGGTPTAGGAGSARITYSPAAGATAGTAGSGATAGGNGSNGAAGTVGTLGEFGQGGGGGGGGGGGSSLTGASGKGGDGGAGYVRVIQHLYG